MFRRCGMFRAMTQASDFTRLAAVQTRVADALRAAGRPSDACRLIVVSKTQSAERLAPLVQHQRIELGENYLSEALPKIEALPKDLVWHYIGSIQSNKTAPISEYFDWVHTVDREKIAQRLNDQRPQGKAALNVLIQVNLDAEASKAGCHPDQVMALAHTIDALPHLTLRGLMSIPAPNPEDPADPHRRLAQLMEPLRERFADCDCLSMGMSGDMDEAIASGATYVRVGTAIFGPRPPKETP